jgi:hypothetical protein
VHGEVVDALMHQGGPGALDWQHVVELARQHSIAPFIYDQIHRHGVSDLFPAAVIDGLRQLSHRNALRNALLFQELHKILTALQGTACEVIVLKGAALAETVYMSRALRSMGDIDLLVRQQDVVSVEHQLLAMQFVHDEGSHSREWYKAHFYHLVFRKPHNPLTDLHLEVHWHIERPSGCVKVEIDRVWERAVPVTVAGVDVRVLSPEDLLLHLCLHTCMDRFSFGLRPFCDVSAILCRADGAMDWDYVQQCAHEWRLAPFVFLTLWLAKTFVGAAVPDLVLWALKPRDLDDRLLEWARAEVLAARGTLSVSRQFLRLWAGKSFTERVTVLKSLFSPTVLAREYALPVGSTWVYGYYPRRLKDLLRRYGPVWWGVLCRDQPLLASVQRKAQVAAWVETEQHRRQSAANV